MKHFIIDILFVASLEWVDPVVPAHRAFLQTGYDRGWLLSSGPKVPRTGGIIVARAPSLEAIQEFFQNDPYLLNQVAEYRFVEYNPVKRQPVLEAWTSDEVV